MAVSNGKTVVVTGATGHQGGAVARHLLAAGFGVRALTRKPGSQPAAELAQLGAEVVKCDLNDAAAVRRALNGAWGAFGVFGPAEEGPRQEENQANSFAEQAKTSGLQHYVYSSVASAHRKTGIPHFENKWRVENTVRRLGFPSYNILRPAFFMENFMGPWLWPGLEQGRLSMALKPETKIQMVAVDDIGSYGLMAFEKTSQLNRAEIELAGDELTMPQAAEILTGFLGRQIRYEPAPIEDIRKSNPDMAVMYDWLNRVGLNVDIGGLKNKYRLDPMNFRQWAAKVIWPVPLHR